MRIGIPAEIRPGETRVAATPETIKKLVQGGLHTVFVQSGAGISASIPDSQFTTAGATIVASAAEVYGQSDIVLKVRGPEPSEIPLLRRGVILIALLNPFNTGGIDLLAGTGVTGFALESVPRITRAQAMDVLSSQANIAGYKAVMLAANEYGRFMPMLMTAAGTVKAARVLILGVGVAGLQAIATAKRLGAVIEAFDVRPATKEQVESLGAKFVEVPVSEEEKRQAETSGGYARQMSEDYQRRQAALIDERARLADIVITTALIPGRPAPVLLREETVKGMKPGSVVVDLAVEQGGNCPLSEKDSVCVKYGVTLVGHSNLPSLLAADASALYARNLLNFINLLVDPKTGELKLNREDEIIAGALACIDGAATRKDEAVQHMTGIDHTVINLTIFVLAVFVGYHVVWGVTPALHTPLMSVTNAISSVIVVGAILASGPGSLDFGSILGAVAVGLVAINTFGGFLVSQRMLEMFKKKDPASRATGHK